MSNGRCRMHGGKSTGAPKGNTNRKTAGSIYSKYLTEEEQAISEQLALDAIDDELRLQKIRLMRVLAKEKEQAEIEQALELEAVQETPVNFGGMPDYNEEPIKVKTFKRKNYDALIDQITARIQSLTTQRNSLLASKIDIELKQIELDKMKSAQDEAKAQPIQVVIDVKDARKYAEPEQETS